MKTTKLINGKTFDEIFTQRGRKISVEEMVAGRLYLLDTDFSDNWYWLSIFNVLNNETECPSSIIGTTNDLHSDGDNMFIDSLDTTMGFSRTQWGHNCETSVFEATNDQIALHNLYMLHEE